MTYFQAHTHICCTVAARQTLSQQLNVEKEGNQIETLFWSENVRILRNPQMRPAWFHNSRQSGGRGPPQSGWCYFDTGWQWAGRRGHERQCFTSESRSDLTWIKWRNARRRLPRPPAPRGEVSGGSGGEVRTAQRAASGMLLLNAGWAIYSNTPPPPPPPPPLLPPPPNSPLQPPRAAPPPHSSHVPCSHADRLRETFQIIQLRALQQWKYSPPPPPTQPPDFIF